MTKHSADCIPFDEPIPYTLTDLSTPEGRRRAAEREAEAVEAGRAMPPRLKPATRTLWRDPSLSRWLGCTPATPRALAARLADERLELVANEVDAHLVSSLCTDGQHRPCFDCDFDVTATDAGSGRTLVIFDTTPDVDAWDHLHDFLFDLGWVAAALPKTEKSAFYFTVPVRVIASSTPGHFHVYIDEPIAWGTYRELLELIRVANVILGSTVPYSIQRGQSMLLRPGLTKAKMRESGQ